ncbi:MAG TPA: HAMP domain-containing sensor histidine kinase [Gaiellaceae bacterium]|nr:HAMP domain-containing sensor histidine kinase [Gaiellaceae bacterium]
MLDRISLRTRLVVGVIVLAAVGLGAADVATYASLRSFLVDRVDSSLDEAHTSVDAALFGRGGGGGPGGPPGPGGGPGRAAPGDCVEVRTLGDAVLQRLTCAPQFSQSKALPAPRLPSSIALPSSPNTPEGDRVSYLTVPAVSGGGRYRVRASIESRAPGRVLLVAAPLNSVDSTLHRLVGIEALVTGLVLVGLAVLGLWVVRLSLAPLRAIEKTAASIAAGDLTQRVERAEPRTEVGRLGLALNAMLGQIERAFKAQEASERRLRRFVADASHELRTPLAAVRAYAELFTRGAASRPADLERSMAGISRESERMSVLVDDLLLLARLDEGRPLEREPLRLDELVGEAVETARTVDPERPIELVASPVSVVGDRDRLRQIVDNLLANVRAHTPPASSATVSVGSRNAHAFVEVSDTGPGMSAEDAERAFERFYRSDDSRSRASGGVGLGLSIVAAVAAAHGGRATAASGPGGGATFTIELPAADGETHSDL